MELLSQAEKKKNENSFTGQKLIMLKGSKSMVNGMFSKYYLVTMVCKYITNQKLRNTRLRMLKTGDEYVLRNLAGKFKPQSFEIFTQIICYKEAYYTSYETRLYFKEINKKVRHYIR